MLFGKDFYPTPDHLIDKMVSMLDFRYIKTILEPSAGAGNIVDALMDKTKKKDFYYNKIELDIDCVEIEPELRSVLKGKGYRVVHDDFLTFNTHKEYDLIIANFPFSNGVKHLLKAMEMQRRNGGAILCFINAETLKNPCSNDRITLNRYLEEYGAEIEFIEDGFIDADRKTGVEVALIKVLLPESAKDSFILDRLKKAKEQTEINDKKCFSLIENDYLKSIVNQYNLEVEAGINLIKEYRAMAPYILSDFKKDENGECIQSGSCILNLDLSSNRGSYTNSLTINGYIREVRRKYWTALFNNKSFIGKLTDNLRRSFYNRINELMDYDFTLNNIYEIKQQISENVSKDIEQTIVDLFDEFSHKHHWYDETSSNIHFYNGWKTNQSWIINKKVIIPLNAYGTYSHRFDPDYTVKSKIEDIEKCFNYLDGGQTKAVDLNDAFENAKEEEITKNIKLKFFNITFYKKGTCHITFTNDDLLKKFNIFGAMHKGWLPPSYGKAKYQDMTEEEKEVIDSFEGEIEYRKVFNNSDYFLSDSLGFTAIEKVG